jgi:hypothetical protein
MDEKSSSAIYPYLHSRPEGTRCVVLGSIPSGNMIGIRNDVLFINGAIPFFVYCNLFTKPLTSVHKLVLTPLINPLTIAEWSRLFGLLPSISVVEVCDADPGRFLRALRLKPGLPHLTELDIQFSDAWSAAEFNPLGVRYTTEPPSLAALLCSVASQRHLESSRGVAPMVQRFERVYVRFDSRAKAVEDWDPELDAMFDRMREHVGRVLYFKRKWGLWDATAEETEHKKETDDKWYLATKAFEGMWPTKAYFDHLAGLMDKQQ